MAKQSPLLDQLIAEFKQRAGDLQAIAATITMLGGEIPLPNTPKEFIQRKKKERAEKAPKPPKKRKVSQSTIAKRVATRAANSGLRSDVSTFLSNTLLNADQPLTPAEIYHLAQEANIFPPSVKTGRNYISNTLTRMIALGDAARTEDSKYYIPRGEA